MLFFKTAESRAQDFGAPQVSHHAAWVLALHDWQSSNLATQHLRGRIVQGFVNVSKFRIASPGLQNGR